MTRRENEELIRRGPATGLPWRKDERTGVLDGAGGVVCHFFSGSWEKTHADALQDTRYAVAAANEAQRLQRELDGLWSLMWKAHAATADPCLKWQIEKALLSLDGRPEPPTPPSPSGAGKEPGGEPS